MLPSYLMQDGSALNGCVYDCRPRYWMSCLTQHPSTCSYGIYWFSDSCCHYSEPYISCQSCYRKSYVYTILSNSNSRAAIGVFGDGINRFNSMNGMNIECCNYCFCGGTKIKYIRQGVTSVITTTGCGYRAHPINVCDTFSSMSVIDISTISYRSFLNTVGCGDISKQTYGSYLSRTYCIQCIYRLCNSCRPIAVFTLKCNCEGFSSYAVFGTSIKDPLFSYICCECCTTLPHWRGVAIKFYGGVCNYIITNYTCNPYSDTGAMPINFGLNEQENVWFAYHGLNSCIYSQYQWGCANATFAYIMEGDMPSSDFNCIYNNCNTTIKKIWRLPRCIIPYYTDTSAQAPAKSTSYSGANFNICKVNNFYIVNRYWLTLGCTDYAVCVYSNTLNPTPFILNTNTNQVYTVFHPNKSTVPFENFCLGWYTPHFVAYTTRNTFLVANHIPQCCGYIRVFEYTCNFTPISGCCYGMSHGSIGERSPKFLYDCIEDSLMVFSYRDNWCNTGADISTEPTIFKMPSCTGIINNMITSQDLCNCLCTITGDYTCFIKNTHARMCACNPTICTYTLTPSTDILCGTSGCYCGYVSVQCMCCCGTCNIGKYFFNLPIEIVEQKLYFCRGCQTPCCFIRCAYTSCYLNTENGIYNLNCGNYICSDGTDANYITSPEIVPNMRCILYYPI